MARITVEDCTKIINNRFELCLIAGDRARSILSGSPTNYDRSEKPPVIALREIADNSLDLEVIKKNIATGERSYVDAAENITEEVIELTEKEQKMAIFSTENIIVSD